MFRIFVLFLKLPLITIFLNYSFAMEANITIKLNNKSEYEDFTLETSRGIFDFREIVIEPPCLEKSDLVKLTNLVNDYEMLESTFGIPIAAGFKGASYLASLFNYNLPYEIMLEECRKNKEKSLNYKETFWMIEDKIDDSHFIGFMHLVNEAPHAPQEVYEKLNAAPGDLLEIGGCITKDYRGQKVTSSCAIPFIKKLTAINDYKGKWIYFCTKTDNIAACTLAKKFGFTDLGVTDTPVAGFNFGFWNVTLSVKHFVYKIEK